MKINGWRRHYHDYIHCIGGGIHHKLMLFTFYPPDSLY